MKKTEIAPQIFGLMDMVPLTELDGNGLNITIADIVGLSLVPWFCDVSVQWAFRLTVPGGPLKKSPLKKVSGSYVALSDDGALLIGVPGDGIEPSLYGAFVNGDPGMTRKLCGLGLGFFRHRLAASPFGWPEPGPVMYSTEQLEETARSVVG
jgi:hypothetical protein